MISSNDQRLDRLNGLAQHIDVYCAQNDMRSDELMIHLVDLINNLVQDNLRRCLATPSFAPRILYIHQKVKESMNKVIYSINSKRNALRSLEKEVRKTQRPRLQ